MARIRISYGESWCEHEIPEGSENVEVRLALWSDRTLGVHLLADGIDQRSKQEQDEYGDAPIIAFVLGPPTPLRLPS